MNSTEATYLLRLPQATKDRLQDLAVKMSRATRPRRKVSVKDLINEAIDDYLKGVKR